MGDMTERAFALARSGQFRSVGRLMAALRAEGFDDVQRWMASSEVRILLRELMLEARVAA